MARAKHQCKFVISRQRKNGVMNVNNIALTVLKRTLMSQLPEEVREESLSNNWEQTLSSFLIGLLFLRNGTWGIHCVFRLNLNI